jgi:4-hydroxy-tetrahydrodipicolinate synthase
MNRDEIRHHLTGPVASIRTPFQRDGSIDWGGLRNVIEFDIAAGSGTIILTAGDSHYFCLSDDEITELTRVTVTQVHRRAMVVAADRLHGTSRAVEFARFATGIGADVLMCLPPDWGGSCTPETLAEHYAEVAKVMPVMMVTNIFPARGTAFGIETIQRALDRSENVVAIKDDVCGEFGRRVSLLAHSRCAIFVSGSKENHLNSLPYGCDGHMSTFLTFKPEIARRYWKAIHASDLQAARGVIRDCDIPFFDLIKAMPGGYDAGIHGVLELFGLAKRWRRKPYHSLSDGELAKLADALKRLRIL